MVKKDRGPSQDAGLTMPSEASEKKPSLFTEGELYEICRNGNSHQYLFAWSYLRQFISRKVARRVGFRNSELVPDITQHTLIEVQRFISSNTLTGSFFIVVDLIAQRNITDFLRRERKRKDSEYSLELLLDQNFFDTGFEYGDGIWSPAASDDGGLGKLGAELEFEERLKCLSPIQKELIVRWLDGFSIPEVALSLDISQELALSLFKKAKKRLRESFLVIGLLPSNTNFDIYMHRGLGSESQGRLLQAIKSYRKAIASIPSEYPPSQRSLNHATAKFRIGLCLKRQGKWLDALNIQLDVANVFGREGKPYQKGEAYFQAGELYQIINIYEPALMYYREAYFQYRLVFPPETDSDLLDMARTKRNLPWLGFHLEPPEAEEAWLDRWEANRLYSALPEKAESALTGMARTKRNLGELEFHLNLLEEASLDLKEAKRLYSVLPRIGDYAIVAEISNMISDIESNLRDKGRSHEQASRITAGRNARKVGL